MSGHLIIGASGLVGDYLYRALEGPGVSVAGTYCSRAMAGLDKLDIRDDHAVRTLISKAGPEVVYLSASFTNVDACQLDPRQSYESNVRGVCNVVQAANEVQAKLVYFSSDYIFDGEQGPYSEGDPSNPICEYGRQKVIAEHYVALQARSYLIIRTTVVYGWERGEKNFIYRLLSALKEGQTLRVPMDQIGSPTYARNLAEVVMRLASSDARGVYHVAGTERVSRYAFACEAAQVFGMDSTSILPVTTSELGQPAPRPLNAGMVVEKAMGRTGIPLMGYKEGLRAMARERGGQS